MRWSNCVALQLLLAIGIACASGRDGERAPHVNAGADAASIECKPVVGLAAPIQPQESPTLAREENVAHCSVSAAPAPIYGESALAVGSASVRLQDPKNADTDAEPAARESPRTLRRSVGPLPQDTYVSRSGKMKVQLATDPGPSADDVVCTLFSDESEAWATRLTSPFYHAVVSDGGFVVGVSYTCGIDGKGCTPETAPGSFVMTILGARGSVVAQNRVDREYSPYSHGLPTPTCSGLHLFEEHDSVLVRTHDVRRLSKGRPEVWSLLQLSTGVALPSTAPQRPFARPNYSNKIAAAAVITGTPLLVVGWIQSDRGLNSRKVDGATVPWHRVFSIVQMDGAVVANISVHVTDVVPEGFTPGRDHALTGFDHGSILRNDNACAFELVLSREGTEEQSRVPFLVERDSTGAWRLRRG